jgi:hypothetical protein
MDPRKTGSKIKKTEAKAKKVAPVEKVVKEEKKEKEICNMSRGKRYAKFIAEITDEKISALPNVRIRKLESAIFHALDAGKFNMPAKMIFRNYYGFGCKQMTMEEIKSKYNKTEAQVHTTRNDCLNKIKTFIPFKNVLLSILKDHTIS